MVSLLAVLGTACAADAAPGGDARLWWERGAATWYYKDDWKGQALAGAGGCRTAIEAPAGAAAGWIVVWGQSGYRLLVNNQLVAANLDGALIDDFDLSRFFENRPKSVTIEIGGARLCAEGEIVDAAGERIAFATGKGWEGLDGRPPRASRMEVEPSSGAFHRAHNGRLLWHNDEERGKSSIARALARIQRLLEQKLFLMLRYRPAAEVLSFDPASPWRRAEELARARAGAAREILERQAIPAQKAGDFADAIARAGEAAKLLDEAEAAVSAAIDSYRPGAAPELGAFPQGRFGWLNARALMENDPARWPFAIYPPASPAVDLSGWWDFRTDPEDEGEKLGWHAGSGEGWKRLRVPEPWERQGILEDNPKSPGDMPYDLGDRRFGDKPYNGFAWYRTRAFLPDSWRGKRIVLATGKIENWARVFANGTPIGEGKLGPASTYDLPDAALRFGAENLIAIQVYNHDNFGGITEGPVRIFAAGNAPEVRETPTPLGWVTECVAPTPAGIVLTTILQSALSPAVLIATDRPALELWGFEARGSRPPDACRLVTAAGPQDVELGGEDRAVAAGSDLAENWLLLSGGEADILLVLEGRPRAVAWEKNAQGARGLSIAYEAAPVRAALLVMPAGSRLDLAACRWWARALRRYPIAATEIAKRPGEHRVRYAYHDLGAFGSLAPLSVAPVPMLLSVALAANSPGVSVDANAAPTGYASRRAPYRVIENAEEIAYRAPPVDRSRVLKGVGELFGKAQAEHNARGGLSEREMYRRMAGWGFDHCRYAFAFHAGWDIPLVRFVGGPPIEDNERMWRRLDELVDGCNAAGMQMMLCWFFNEDSPQRDAGGAVRNSTRYWKARPETKRNAFELWRRIAARYADRPVEAISYDFFNEPAYMNPAHWNEIMRELTAAIRSVDTRHRIVWESADGWAQPHWCAWMEPVSDPNVLYSFHHYGKHWGYAYDEYYPSYRNPPEKKLDIWIEALLFGIRHDVPIHCGEFGISMIQPEESGAAWLEDYLAFFDRFGIGWNWWNYSGQDIYRTGLCAGDRISPFVPILKRWAER